MKKIMLLTILMCQMLWPLSVPAQDSGPSRVDGLLLRDSMLVLWSMGLEKSGPKTQDTLCRDALFFVILSEGLSACGVERSRHPEFFQATPENYEGFVPKQKVEEAARTIFAQEVSKHVAPEGTSFNGKGYFLDLTALSDKTGYLCHLMPKDRRPGHVSHSGAHNRYQLDSVCQASAHHEGCGRWCARHEKRFVRGRSAVSGREVADEKL